MTELPNPLDAISDLDLWNSHLLLKIVCNRGKVRESKKHLKSICGLGNALQIEADNRGVQAPTAPYNISKLKV